MVVWKTGGYSAQGVVEQKGERVEEGMAKRGKRKEVEWYGVERERATDKEVATRKERQGLLEAQANRGPSWRGCLIRVIAQYGSRLQLVVIYLTS